MRTFELRYPGTSIQGMQQDQVFQAQHFLYLLETDLADAAVTLELFEQTSAELKQRFSRAVTPGAYPHAYEQRLPFIYAHAFLYALDGMAKGLAKLKRLSSVPAAVAAACDALEAELPGVVRVRDSAHHKEDRSRGLGKHEKPLALQPVTSGGIHAPGGGLLVLSMLSGNRLGYTTEDGHLTEVEVTAATVAIAQRTIQAVLGAFSWSGPERVTP